MDKNIILLGYLLLKLPFYSINPTDRFHAHAHSAQDATH
jgi:hypothetical protein